MYTSLSVTHRMICVCISKVVSPEEDNLRSKHFRVKILKLNKIAVCGLNSFCVRVLFLDLAPV